MSYELKRNIETEIEILREISNYFYRMETASENDKKLLMGAIDSLTKSMKIINDSIPGILQEISVAQKLPIVNKTGVKRNRKIEAIEAKQGNEKEIKVFLSKEDKKRLMKELEISERYIKRIKENKKKLQTEYQDFKAARGYLKFANKLFLEQAKKLSHNESFKSLAVEIRKANIDVLLESYIAMMFLTAILSFFAGLFLAAILLFFNIGIDWPFFTVYTGSIVDRAIKVGWIPIALPLLVFLIFYYYPSGERKSIEKKINQELPFAVIHMSAISGSGIEPSQIFRIIALNKEYVFLRKEFRKVLNQINLYGYDLVTALNNAAKTSPSEKLAELFSGLSITITSGSSMQNFLEKRSETLLLNYRLERENYTRMVETFLDIYISIVIAAPMIFLLLLIMMVVSGMQVGFSPGQISVLTVFGIAILNIVFIMVVRARQPTY